MRKITLTFKGKGLSANTKVDAECQGITDLAELIGLLELAKLSAIEGGNHTKEVIYKDN